MRKQTANILFKSPSLITNVDQADLPDDGLAEATNLDLNANGYLQGIKKDSTFKDNDSGESSLTNPVFITKDDGTYDLVYTDKDVSRIKIIQDFYSTGSTYSPGTITGDTNGVISTAIPRVQSALLGLGDATVPKWIGNKKEKFKCTISPVAVTGGDDFEIDATGVTASSTHNLSISVASPVTEHITDLADGSTISSKYSGLLMLKGITDLAVYTVREYYPVRINVYDGFGESYDIITEVQLITKGTDGGGVNYIIVNYYFSSDYNWVDITRGNPPFYVLDTDPAVSIKEGLWTDLGTTGAKIRFNKIKTLKNGDNWNLTFTATSPTLIIEDAELTHVSGDISIEVDYKQEGTYVGFTKGTEYYYGYSLQYENEESPVYYLGTFTPFIDSSSADIKVTVTTTNLKGRVTGINIYGATGTSFRERGYWRLIKEADVNVGHWTFVDSSTVSLSFSTDGNWNESYESRTGIPDTMESTIINYGLAAELNGNLFVAEAKRKEFDTNLYIFKSQLDAYSTFNWTSDLLKLPEKPVALVSFANKIWAFMPNKIYRINYDLYIEDVTEGIGCHNKYNVIVTEYGMFFAGKFGVYKYSERGFERIDEPVRNVLGTPNDIAFESNEKYLILRYGTNAYYFQVERNLWAYGTILNSAQITDSQQMFTGIYGEVFCSAYDSVSIKEYIFKLFGSTVRNSISIKTKYFDMGEAGELKKYYLISLDTDSILPTVSFSTSRNEAYTNSVTLQGSYKMDGELKKSGDWVKSYIISFNITTSGKIYSISFIYRIMEDKRG